MKGSLLLYALILFLLQGKVLSHDLLKGKSLIFTGEGHFPYFIPNNIPGQKPNGVIIDLVDILAEAHGFDYTFYWASYGNNFIDRKWTGAFGEVIRGNADVAVGAYSFTFQRAQAVDYLIPLFFPQLLLIARQPKPLPQIINVTKPFTIPGWILFLVAIIATGLMHILAVNVTPAAIDTIKTSSMYIICILCEQGTTLRARPISGFTYTFAFLLFTTILWQAYDCNLRSYLISVDYEKPIDTMADILDLDWNFYYPEATGMEQVLANSQIKEYREVYKIAKQRGNYLGLSKGRPFPMEKFIEDNMVTVIEEAILSSFMKSAAMDLGPNVLRVGKPVSIFFYSSLAVAKNSNLKAKFDMTLASVLESGILGKVFDKYEVRVDSTPPDDEDIPLNMDHIILPLFFLAFGLVTALIQFVREQRDGPGLMTIMKNSLKAAGKRILWLLEWLILNEDEIIN